MELENGREILIDGVKYKIIGILKFNTYTDYHLRSGKKNFWLDNCNGWRLWKKTSHADSVSSYIMGLLNQSAKSLVELIDRLPPELDDIVVRSIGTESVQVAIGQVEGTKSGEVVFYLEGEPIYGSNGCGLFAAEVWDDEVEFYEGDVVQVEKV